jgi:glycosyltransferase involved in cell wall biosynthesis
MTGAAPAARAARPLRVGILTDGLVEREGADGVEIANGGVGVYVRQLVTHLRRVDPLTAYVTIRLGAGRLDLFTADGGRQHIALPGSTAHRLAAWVDLPYRRLARDFQLDLLHFPNQFGGAFLPRATRRVVTLHDVTPLLFPDQHPPRRVLGYRLLLRRALQRADHVIVDAAHTAAELVARGLVDRARLSVIPLAADERFSADAGGADVAARYQLPARYILTVGVLEPRKNHARLVEALGRLHAAGDAVHLVIVGREGWRWRDPLAMPGLAHLRPYVRVLRHVPDADLPGLYRRAAVFAYPSLYEGFGLPLVEAMACGTPVVSSRAASLPEVAGDAAVLVDPGDVGALAEALRAVLRDAALAGRLREAGLRRSRQLTWRRTAEATRAVYERVCRGA